MTPSNKASGHWMTRRWLHMRFPAERSTVQWGNSQDDGVSDSAVDRFLPASVPDPDPAAQKLPPWPTALPHIWKSASAESGESCH